METINNIRDTFLSYFKKNDHRVVKSSSLVPINDPSLMFTNAGMVQFKNVFTGLENLEYKRAVTSQKCVRAGGKHNDLDNVGYTSRHHTFFEMLGNFSFGDYFKSTAIPLAWDLLTKEFNISPEKLCVTIYHDDDESALIWKKYTGLPDQKIIRISSSDNFWSMGNIGPCGPCSEIFYDHGADVPGGPPGSYNEDGDRFVEIWNLVFMQFEKFEDGNRINLPKPSIDTGMGLERIGAVLQGKHDNYEIDTMKKLINACENITSVEVNQNNKAHFRVIADHIRSCSFLISDGVVPSNEGRGYVLRRIMRRAMRHSHILGFKENLMHKLVEPLVKEMGKAFPELNYSQKVIEETLEMEENKFKVTLERGIRLLDDEMSNLSNNGTLSGSIAFRLYDTFGFPLDLTEDALREKGFKLDFEGFNNEMLEQKRKARSAWTGTGDENNSKIWFDIFENYGSTEFLGYSVNSVQAKIQEMVKAEKLIKKSKINEEVAIIVNQSPFYAESGGQTSDIGYIKSETGKARVNKVEKKNRLIIHYCKVIDGFFEKDSTCDLTIDCDHRLKVSTNHTATHLLHEALRLVLGDHVVQKGSLNSKDRLRFDFSNPKPLTRKQILKIEKIVNSIIKQNVLIETQIMSLENALKTGSRALFGEKYDEEVRVVKIKSQEIQNFFSSELCGGTHLNNTSEIGFFKVFLETSSSSGVRRIEAYTGEKAIDYISDLEQEFLKCSDLLKVNSSKVYERVLSLVNEKKILTNKINEMSKNSNFNKSSKKINFISEKFSNFTLNYVILKNLSNKELREILDNQKKINSSKSITLILSVNSDKVIIIAGVTKDLLSDISSVDIVNVISIETGGKGGGGRPDMAQAGGTDSSKIEKALDVLKSKLQNKSFN